MLTVLKGWLIRGHAWLWDKWHGVETRSHVAVRVGHAYEPIGLHHVRAALHAVPFPIEMATFVDVGCGKGRVLLAAARAGFHSVVGIETDVRLVQQARENVRRCRGIRRSPISIVHA